MGVADAASPTGELDRHGRHLEAAMVREALADAVEQWTAYLLRAEADHAPWVQPARLHKASVERELAKLPVSVPKSGTKPPHTTTL